MNCWLCSCYTCKEQTIYFIKNIYVIVFKYALRYLDEAKDYAPIFLLFYWCRGNPVIRPKGSCHSIWAAIELWVETLKMDNLFWLGAALLW